jgi:hypothetical protein
MTTPRARLGRLLVPLLALPVAVATAGSAGAATPPTLPPGYVELIDDTGLLTVAVPDTWTDVDTVPGTNADGTAQPWISASPDFAQFQATFDVSGMVYTALPFADDPESLIEQFSLPEGSCDELELTSYEDNVFTGVVQVGTGCGETGAASWVVVVANPADKAFTALVQVQTASADENEAIVTILETFNRTDAGATAGSTTPGASVPSSSTAPAPAASVPTVSVPAGLGPVEVATMFLDALSAGDGATACALLTAEEMTINFVEEADTCAAELSLQVLGQGEFWASVQIEGDETTSSPGQCGEEDPADEHVSLELQGPTDDGCLSISIDSGEWRIEDLSNSIWNQAG